MIAFSGHKYAVKASDLVANVTQLEGGHWGRRSLFPGARTVWDRACGTGSNCMKPCTPDLCPHALSTNTSGRSTDTGTSGAQQERLVNFAPFFAEGGESYAIRNATDEQQKKVDL